MYDRQLGVF